ncbi:MAG TPA: TRAP transporter substrate-binding protein DctP [Candidatus Acidoferrales bacterium]|nr:TRAP transporter substrate-binding protein DctP [Candidatus Acidoferrales bacterium]
MFRRMRKMDFFAVVLGIALGILIDSPRASGQSRIRLATLVPRGTSIYNSLEAMGQSWRQAPNGGVSLTIYPDGVMGSEADMVRRMRIGQIQAATLTVGGLSEIDPSVAALQTMPMMYRSLDEAEYVRQKLEPELDKRLRDRGFVVLFWGDAGWVRFFSRKDAIRPEDFKKMKLFVTAGDSNEVDVMRKAGYNPVPLEWTDVLTSLETGLIDAVPTAPFVALAGQFYTAAPHMLQVNWVPLVGATVITKKAWDAMPPATQQVMLQTATETGKQIQARNRQESDEAVEAMKKRGLQVNSLPPAEEEAWTQVAKQFYPDIRGRMVPADMFDEVERLLAEYRAHSADNTGTSR